MRIDEVACENLVGKAIRFETCSDQVKNKLK